MGSSLADTLTQAAGFIAQQLGMTAEAFQALIPDIVAGIYQAFSLAVAGTFWLGVATSAIALVAVAVALPEVPLRGLSRQGEPDARTAASPASVAAASD
ncbi:MAG: hypothetical protein R3C32_11160 [Chloroflexota bacterium]